MDVVVVNDVVSVKKECPAFFSVNVVWWSVCRSFSVAICAWMLKRCAPVLFA